MQAASGLLVHAGYALADLDPAGIDTVVAVGGAGVDLARRDRVLVEWLADDLAALTIACTVVGGRACPALPIRSAAAIAVGNSRPRLCRRLRKITRPRSSRPRSELTDHPRRRAASSRVKP